MKISPLPAVIAMTVILVILLPPVQADSVSDLVQSASMDLLGMDITDSKPAYMKTAQDWMNEGNSWKARCEYKSARYNERVSAYVAAHSSDPSVAEKWENPDADERMYLIATGFHVIDPEAGRLFNEMMAACAAADEAYRQAYALTGENDYDQHAEIFDEAAGVYDAVGNREGAGEVRDAAAVARGHAAAGTFLPLPWWTAALVAAVGLFIIRRVIR